MFKIICNKSFKKYGFITLTEIICFFIINVLMLTSFFVASSIRRVQDEKYLAKLLLEKQKLEEEKKKNVTNQQVQTNKKEPLQIGMLPKKTSENQITRRQISTNTTVVTPQTIKKVVQPPIQTSTTTSKNLTPTTQTVSNKVTEVKSTKEINTIDVKQQIETNDNTFTSRFSNLFFLDIDSLGVEVYDYKVAKKSSEKEITLLKLLNLFQLPKHNKQQSDKNIYLAVNTNEINISYYNKKQEITNEVVTTNAKNLNEEKKIIPKFLYSFKNKTYIATTNGLYLIKNDEIFDIQNIKNQKLNFEAFLHDVIIPEDVIIFKGDKNLLYVGTKSTIYIVDLLTLKVLDIGIDEIFNDNSQYSFYVFKNKLYLANNKALFYYDLSLDNWFAIPYEKFIGIKECKVLNIFIFQQNPSTSIMYMLITEDNGIITDKLPSFDPKIYENEKNLNPKVLKKVFDRDLLSSIPVYSFDDNKSIWLSFEKNNNFSYELIRYDKQNNKYERFNITEKLKYLYAIDSYVYNDNLIFLTNGEEVFSIFRILSENLNAIYSFINLATLSGCISITFSDDYIICGTYDGEIFKMDVSELIKKIKP